MRMFALFLPVLCATLLSSSAMFASSFEVEIDSLMDPSAEAKRIYVIHPGVEGILPTDLQFKEFAKFVDRALQL